MFYFIELLILLVILPINISRANDSIIIWSKDYKLIASDFKCKTRPKPDTVFYGVEMQAAATCNLKVKMIYNNGSQIFYILPYFEKNLSWIDNTLDINKVIIHEQLHFDITEMVARKLRREIMNYQNKGIRQIELYSELYKNHMRILDEWHDELDIKTLHGTFLIPQQEFQEKLINELNKFEEYSTDKYCFSEDIINEIFNSE